MIYIVEDDSSIRELEKYALQTNDFEVEGFADGKSFWTAVHSRLPELVILDVMKQKRFKKLTLHSKVVITSSITLIVVGTLLLKATEDITWLGAFFQSVSARTAGFSTYTKVSNDFTVAETVIVGTVPGSYVYFNGNYEEA